MWWDSDELAEFALEECIRGINIKKNKQLILSCKNNDLKDKLIYKYYKDY